MSVQVTIINKISIYLSIVFMDARRAQLLEMNFIKCSKAEIQSPCSEN